MTDLCLGALGFGLRGSLTRMWTHTAWETGTRLYVGHNMRHMPVVRVMRDIVARGEIGEIDEGKDGLCAPFRRLRRR
jgi:hypothetical protein